MPDERAPAGTLRVVSDGRTVIGTGTGWVPARFS